MPRQCRFLNNLTNENSKAWECIHQFHPLIRFISHRLKELDEAFYPLVAVRVPAEEVGNFTPGNYMFALRRWTFSGVREEECLQSAVCSLTERMPLADEQQNCSSMLPAFKALTG